MQFCIKQTCQMDRLFVIRITNARKYLKNHLVEKDAENRTVKEIPPVKRMQ